jgi:regulator of RNase E activity RraA
MGGESTVVGAERRDGLRLLNPPFRSYGVMRVCGATAVAHHPTERLAMIDAALLDELKTFSTPSILNGLKRLGVPPEKLETMDRLAIRAMSPQLGVRVGFAATRKVATRRSGGPSQAGPGGLDGGVLAVPAPRILVAENIGDWRGPVCIWGDVAANINLALGCTGGITNGPVRDIPEIEALGFATFAGGAGPGGGYVDTLEVGVTVVVGGMSISPGDLLHGDQHGVVKIPLDLAPALPDAIRTHEAHERKIIAICQSPDFSIEALGKVMRGG